MSQKMFELLGDQPDRAKAEAAKVLEIETVLAKASLTRVERRDPYKLFHKVDFKGLQAMTPDFDWSVYIKGVGLAPQNVFNVDQPAFYAELDKQFKTLSLDDIKTYLRWHTAHAVAPYLSDDFVNENFNFFSKTLRGVPQLRPRWKRCVTLVDQQLGEALGQEFVARAFSPELKAENQPDGPANRALHGRGHRNSRLDEPGDTPAGARKAAHHRQQNRISRQMARLQFGRHQAQRFCRQRAAGHDV